MTKRYAKIKTIILEITTGKKSRSGTNDLISLQIGGHQWILDKPRYDDFERGKTDIYELDVPPGMDASWFRFLCFQKKIQSGKDDDWQIEKIVLTINGKVVYEKANLDIWMKADRPRWCAHEFTYGKAGE